MKAEIVICDLCGQMTEVGDKVGGETPFILGVIVDDKGRSLTENAGSAHSQICLECMKAVLSYTRG
jgi:hypothetical protein